MTTFDLVIDITAAVLFVVVTVIGIVVFKRMGEEA